MGTVIVLVFMFIVALLIIGILFQLSKEEQLEEYNISNNNDMGIYKELDSEILNICRCNNVYCKTEITDDNSGYYVFFIGNDKNQNVKEAIKLIENLGLRKIDLGAFNHTMHYFMIDLKQ